MSTDTIGASGADYTTIAAWAADVSAIGTLTENEEGQLIDDANYAWSAASDLDFESITLDGFTITMRGTGSGINDGDFGNGARVNRAGANFGGLYEPKKCILEDLAFEHTGANVFAVLRSGAFTGRRLLATCSPTGGSQQICFDSFSGNPGFDASMHLEACRAVGGKTGVNMDHLDCTMENVTVTGAVDAFDASLTITGNIQNNASFDCSGTEWTGTYSGTNTNNASEDGTHPGTSGVTISGDPFDADGYTPAASGQLDGAGVDLSISLDAANNSYESTPSIGAYEVIGGGGGISIPVVMYSYRQRRA